MSIIERPHVDPQIEVPSTFPPEWAPAPSPETPSEAEKVAELLNKAADLIKEKGWTRVEFESERGYCALGAIGAAADLDYYGLYHYGRDPIYTRAIDTLAREVNPYGPGRSDQQIWRWNDRMHGMRRSRKRRVIKAMHRAAKRVLRDV